MSQALDWDEAYRTGRYQSFWDLKYPSPELVGYLAARAPGAGRAAVDLGCGAGKDTALLAAAGYHAHGLDISARALRIAMAHAAAEHAQVHWQQGNVLALPYDDATFDLVTDRGCFHHLTEAERTVYASEVARVMTPGVELLLRGCCAQRFPFVPITVTDLKSHFPADRFEHGAPLPVTLVTDAGPLQGIVCVLRRR